MDASVEIVVISRKGRLPACRNPTAVAAEHRCKGNLGCFFFGELPAPRGTTGRRGSRSAVVVFHVAGGLFVGGLAPVVPSLRADVLAEVAIHEQRVGVGPPRTPEIHLVYLGSCRKPAVIEHVTEGLGSRCGGSCDVAVGLTEDGAILKPRRAWTEDEVGGALDVAAEEIETGASHAGVDGVLVAEEAAVDKGDAVALGVQGHGLPETGGIVFYRDVPKRDVAAFYLQCIGAESAHRPAVVKAFDVGMIVVGDDGLVAVFPTNLDVGEPRGDNELLLIDALFDEYHFVIVHEGAAHLDGIIDVAELAGAVAGDEERVGIVILVGGVYAGGGQQE